MVRGDLIEVFKFIQGKHADYLQDTFEIEYLDITTENPGPNAIDQVSKEAR